MAFENGDIDTISLNVYEQIKQLTSFTKKEGFEIVRMVEVPIRKYIMKKGQITVTGIRVPRIFKDKEVIFQS